jgi:hypothetical protein
MSLVVFIHLKSVYISRMKAANHGGARRNAGKRTEKPAESMARVQFTIDPKTRDLLRVLGDGNESKGVREAARIAYAVYQRSP